METPPRPPQSPMAVAASLKELPPPDALAQAHSEALSEVIRTEIAAHGGAIPFARFMQLALYAPGLGYYSAGSRKFGEGGDFTTAPELSPLFSRCLARQCAQVLESLGHGDILEFGAGTGSMASAILAELAALGSLPQHYYILELSADLRERQQQAIQAQVPQLAARVVWLDALPEKLRGVVLANEVIDAMPVERFRITHEGVEVIQVAWVEGQFVERSAPADAVLSAAVNQLREEVGLAEGYASEINLLAAEWVHSLGECLEAGVALLIDYGFPRREYYHPQRFEGTLMCHYRHRAHTDPLILPGLQDITAHVDFTAVGEAALAAGLQVLGFANQANFLLASGLLELAAEAGEAPRQQLAVAAQVKRLTLPGEMGEIFKVMALGRGMDTPLRGFMLRDERGRL